MTILTPLPPPAPNRAKIRRMIAQPRARAHRDPRRATLKMPKKTKKTKKTRGRRRRRTDNRQSTSTMPSPN